MLLVLAGFGWSASAQRNVTLLLNSASIPDTIKTTSDFQVRGGLSGGGTALPGGGVLDWNASTTVRPTNIGGDYWRVTFQAPNDQSINFKFFSQAAEDAGINGWENDPNKTVPVGDRDTTLVLHFFEWQGREAPNNYAWRPWVEKEDSVAVWFRVFMDTEHALDRGYDPADPAFEQVTIGVRGDDLGARGPLDWGTTKVTLTRERTERNSAGYHLFSGVAYYPKSLAGTTQAYKFFVNPNGWEDGNVPPENRRFVIPQNDTTLAWVYFGNTKPNTGAQRITRQVVFSVDLSPLESIGLFDVNREDELQVRGGFNGWGCDNPDLCLMNRVPPLREFDAIIPISSFIGTVQEYKFFINFNPAPFEAQFGRPAPSGWEEDINLTGKNRTFVFTGEEELFTGVNFFNGIMPGNIIPAGTTVSTTFSVDMTEAISDAAQPFVPGTDDVFIDFEDPIWLFTQGKGDDEPSTRTYRLSRVGESNIYEGTFAVAGPTYSGLQYKYTYGSNQGLRAEPGGSTTTQGRRRTRFIVPNQDGSWPTAYTLTGAPETFQPEAGALPYECNPSATGDFEYLNQPGCLPSSGSTSIEDLQVLPSGVTLVGNFPNPFSASTVIEFGVDAPQHVRLSVYDLTGREVAVLVDGYQAASTYRVAFDGSELASGVYVYRLQTGDKVLSRTLVLTR